MKVCSLIGILLPLLRCLGPVISNITILLMMFMDFPSERAVSSEGESLATYIEATAISYELD